MKHCFITTFIFSGLVLSGCHKLGKKRCNDCPQWTKVEIQKTDVEVIPDLIRNLATN